MRRIKSIVGLVTFLAMAWIFIGVERVVGDHEIGVSHDLFIKHRPSMQFKFQNPAHQNLELVAFHDLSPAEQASFMEFCAIRFGLTDATQCMAVLKARIF